MHNPRNSSFQRHVKIKGVLDFCGVHPEKDGKYSVAITTACKSMVFGVYDSILTAKSVCIQLYHILLKDRSPHAGKHVPDSTVKVEYKTGGKIIITAPQNVYKTKNNSDTGICGITIDDRKRFVVFRTINGVQHRKYFDKLEQAKAMAAELFKIPRVVEYDVSHAAKFIEES